MARCRCQTASALGRSTAESRSSVRDSTRPSSRVPAVCTTAVTGCSAGTAANSLPTASGSLTSQTARVTSAPRPASSAASSPAPGASGPRRPASTRWRTPRSVTRWRARTAPRPPVPPVTTTVPSGFQAGAVWSPSGRTRASRAANTAPPRSAVCGSWAASAAASAAGSVSAAGSRSSRPKRWGCSAWAERTRPQAAAAAGSVSGPSAAATAPRVTNTRREPSRVSSASQCRMCPRTRAVSAWTSAGTASESLPATGTRTSSGVSAPPVPVRGVTVHPAAVRAAPSRCGSVPSRPTVPGASVSAAPCGRVQSRWKRASRSSASAAARRASGAERSTRVPTEATGTPVVSATVRVTASSPAGVMRTRASVAPAAWRVTSCQAKGSPPRASSPSGARAVACRAASSSAGCRPKEGASPAGPASRATSA
ncbi:hypothetical protein EES47_24775 [Streptomyces sp. ADI98-12]|nr:hypothetical protein EES47_24775 [Streptomyces sp. ADI98-12]